MNIRKLLCLIAIITFCAASTWAQESRNIDGSGNNLTNSDFGASFTPLARIMTSGYGDGVSSPGGADRPNPRVISNALFSQTTNINDGMGLSDFLWCFGQFIDHDIVETAGNPAEPALIPVDFVDQWFNPSGSIPNINIPMFRNMPAAGTGTDANNPRGHLNRITAWLDGSAVYGSDEHRANWIRTFEEGKLKTSSGNLLPWNTYSGEKGSDVDPDAPEMADDVGLVNRLFVAGDVRANEQPLLTALHTVFVREHNRLCEELIIQHPNWTDQELYESARRWVGAIFQAIVFEEWLPAMGVHLPAYTGYNAGLNPAITNVFSAAAFRLGHTLLNGNIQRMDSSGEIIPEGNLTLAQAFFNPNVIEDVGLEPYFKGMAAQVEQAMDSKLIDDVRNFLFGPPGAGGLDLAAININRGRERGLPDLNTIRTDLGLMPFTNFTSINDDPAVSSQLENIYTGLDKIDPWVGMLAENAMPDALFGETIMEIIMAQFQALRDADRFYYQNDPAFTSYDRMVIQNTSLKDVIMRNTGITLMQENVFLATAPENICATNNAAADVLGTVKTINGDVLSAGELTILDANNSPVTNMVSDVNGAYAINDLTTCNYYQVQGERNTADFKNGINSLDIILMARHILQLRVETNPVKLAAADVDGDFRITTFDLVELQKLLLVFTTEFPNQVPSWRLIPEATVNSGVDPYPAFFNAYFDLGLLQDNAAVNWIGYKMGDFDATASANSNAPAENRGEPFALNLKDQTFQIGEQVSIELSAAMLKELYAVQLSLGFDLEALSLKHTNEMPGLLSNSSAGRIDFSWYQAALENETPITLTFEAKQNGQLSDFLSLSNEGITNTVVDSDMRERAAYLNFETITEDNFQFSVYQNVPNPFKDQTTLTWYQAFSGNANLEIFTANGALLYQEEGEFAIGLNQIEVPVHELGTTGLLFYRISTEAGAVTKRMIAIP